MVRTVMSCAQLARLILILVNSAHLEPAAGTCVILYCCIVAGRMYTVCQFSHSGVQIPTRGTAAGNVHLERKAFFSSPDAQMSGMRRRAESLQLLLRSQCRTNACTLSQQQHTRVGAHHKGASRGRLREVADVADLQIGHVGCSKVQQPAVQRPSLHHHLITMCYLL